MFADILRQVSHVSLGSEHHDETLQGLQVAGIQLFTPCSHLVPLPWCPHQGGWGILVSRGPHWLAPLCLSSLRGNDRHLPEDRTQRQQGPPKGLELLGGQNSKAMRFPVVKILRDQGLGGVRTPRGPGLPGVPNSWGRTFQMGRILKKQRLPGDRIRRGQGLPDKQNPTGQRSDRA